MNSLLLLVSFIVVVFAVPPIEEKRLLQFSEEHIEWVPVSKVEKFICDPKINFMDITDYQYQYAQEYKEIEALPLPSAPTNILPLADVSLVEKTITSLSEFYTRYYKSETGLHASSWLQNEYQRIADESGRDDVKVANITNPSFPQVNVVATIQGSGPNKDNIVILGGHLDSVGSTTAGRSPGADDDASGASSVLEVFRVLLAAKYKPDFTIQFFGYAAEEGGLLGSQGIAVDYQKRSVPVYAALQLDMTGYTNTGKPQVGIVTDYTNAELNEFVRLLVSTYTQLSQSNKQCGYACSDHASWNKTGYRSSFPFETNSNPKIHSSSDVIANLRQELALVAPFFTLRELCACARVCCAWRRTAYCDARWCVLRDSDLQVFDDAGLSALALRTLPLVQVVELKHSVEDSIVKFDLIAQMPKLRHVNSSQPEKEMITQLITNLPKKQLLTFGGYSSRCDSLDLERLLSHFPDMEQLLVRASGFVDSTASLLGPSIKKLNIHGCMDITDFTLKYISKNCPNLGYFEMGGATHKIGGEVLTCTKVSDEGLLALSELKKLYSLGIFHCHTFSAKAIIEFAKNRSTTLIQMDLGGLDCITNDILENIAIVAPNIEIIELEGAKGISLNGLSRAAARWKKLKKIHAFGCTGIKDPLPQNSLKWGWNIYSLNLYACRRMSEEAFEQIMEMCGKSLKKLEITSCGISDNGLLSIAKHCSQLQKLGANFLKVSDSSLAEVILKNKNTLEFIDIHYSIQNTNNPQTENAISNCKKILKHKL